MDAVTAQNRNQAFPSVRGQRAFVVDDTRSLREMVSKFLRGLALDVQQFEDGRDVAAAAETLLPDLIILDFLLPDIDGLSILSDLKSRGTTKNIPVIMVSGYGEEEMVTKALELGADDYISKPFCLKRLKARVNSCLASRRLMLMEQEDRVRLESTNLVLEDRVTQALEQLKSSHMAIVFALSKLAESRDPETGDHLERLREYCKVLGEGLRSREPYQELITDDFLEELYDASPLHDIGKVGIPDSVLLKPGKLTDEEFEIMKSHSVIGAETLREVQRRYRDNKIVAMGIEIARSHHEKWNGRGYPDGLTGEEIPLSARILALADVYDALTSKRVYKPAFSHEKARDIIMGDSGTHFAPDVVEVFVENQDKFVAIRSAYQ